MPSSASYPFGEEPLQHPVESDLGPSHHGEVREVRSDVESSFQFVAVTSPLQGRSVDMARTIRAHVTRRFHELQKRSKGRQRSIAGASRSEGSALVNTSAGDESRIRLCPTCRQPVSDFDTSTISSADPQGDTNTYKHDHDKNEPWSQSMEGYYPMRDTVTIATPSSRNPFDGSSLHRAPSDSNRIVDNFISQYFEANRSSKSPMRSTIMLAGLTYTGLFHGHIYTSIVNVAFLNERPPSHLSLTHRTYAAHFINNSLADAQQACSDEVILTVLTIFNAECLAANIDSAEVHMRGIHLMVNLRGGVDSLGYGGQVKWITLVHDYILCIITSRLAHRFELRSPAGVSLPTYPRKVDFPPDFRLFTLRKDFLDPTQTGTINRYTVTVLEYLCRLSNISTDWHDKSLTEYEKISLANRWLSVRSSLLSLPSSDGSVVLTVTDDNIYESCRLAGIILSSVGLHTVDPYYSASAPQSPSREELKSLKNSLQRTNLFQFWHPIPGALMWILAVGASFTGKGPEKSWFLAHLARTSIVYALTQWDEVEASMKALLYALKGMG